MLYQLVSFENKLCTMTNQNMLYLLSFGWYASRESTSYKLPNILTALLEVHGCSIRVFSHR